MKLRIKGDSLRLRLSQKDVQQLMTTGVVEVTTHFASGPALRYAVETRAEAESIAAEFADMRIVVTLPERDVRAWAKSEQVGLYGETGLLAIAVEKDFACIDRDDPEDVDAFPNPKGAAVC